MIVGGAVRNIIVKKNYIEVRRGIPGGLIIKDFVWVKKAPQCLGGHSIGRGLKFSGGQSQSEKHGSWSRRPEFIATTRKN